MKVAAERAEPGRYPLKVRILARYADANASARLPDAYRRRLEGWLMPATPTG